MSIGAIIIALGLFVDNAIVVAEDMERRLALGEEREQAAAEAGRTMFVPLLVSSLAIILAFLPLALGQTATAEYTRSLGIVLAISDGEPKPVRQPRAAKKARPRRTRAPGRPPSAPT